MSESYRNTAMLTENVSIFIGFFLSHPIFAPLSPNITWAKKLREATHSELLGTKRVKCNNNNFKKKIFYIPLLLLICLYCQQ